MNNFYVITVDNTTPFNLVAFHNYINTTLYPKYINNWWHYIPGNTYFVKSTLNSNQLYNLVFPAIPGRHFIVMKVDPKEQQGWLPKAAWDWFKN